jgi:hypothetical protein
MLQSSYISEIIFELKQQNYFTNFPTLSLLDIPTAKELARGLNHIEVNKKEIFLFAAADYTEIKKQTIFNTLIARTNIENTISCNVILKYVSVNPSYEIDYIPKGYSAICIFEFPDGKPEILNKLAIYGEKKDYSKHDTLILTQKEVLDKLLEEKNKVV